jgi:hypothetical protein
MTIFPFPEDSKLKKEVEALFQVLPFDTRLEGRRKINKELGYTIKPARFNHLIDVARDDPVRCGFSIPRTKQGRRGKNEPNAPRYVCVMKDSNNQPYFNPDEKTQVRGGILSCVGHTETMLRRESDALKLAVAYHEDAYTKRIVRLFMRKLAQLSEDAKELREMLQEENGNGAA